MSVVRGVVAAWRCGPPREPLLPPEGAEQRMLAGVISAARDEIAAVLAESPAGG